MQWRRERDRFRTAQAGDNASAVDPLKHDPSLAKAVEYLETQIK
jgi:hypothetical protein